MDTLKKIINYKREELASLKRRVSLQDVQLRAEDAEPARKFLQNFRAHEINIIAEIKKASPSAGVIRQDFRPMELAGAYEEGGACALSVLTDETYFQGSLADLSQVKKSVGLPCLRKDFTLSEYHLFEARGAGADAILLLVNVLDEHQLRDFHALALELGMMALVEVHDEPELTRALQLNPGLVGVNNRDLRTFKTNLDTSARLIQKIPHSITSISESGLSTQAQCAELVKGGFAGFLIGETLLKATNPAEKLQQLRGY